MYILENEFCEIARLQACGNEALSLGTLEIYLFIVWLGMKNGDFRDVETRYRLFEWQGVSRRRSARAVAELVAAGLLEAHGEVGGTRSPWPGRRLTRASSGRG